MATQSPGGLAAIRQEDLKDPTLFALNNDLQLLYSKVTTLQSAVNSASSSSSSATPTTASAWQSFSPQFDGMGATLGSFVNFLYEYQTDSGKVFVNMDVQFTVVSGSTTQFTITVPSTPANNTKGNILSCQLFTTGSPGIPGMARLNNGKLTVMRADGAAITAGALETMITGYYRGQ